MNSFRVGGSLTQLLEGTAVDAIMKLAGWKTESVCCLRQAPHPAAGSKRGRGPAYDASIPLPCRKSFYLYGFSMYEEINGSYLQ